MGLEKGIVEWVACVAFFLYGFREVVIYVFRFPVGEWESVFVSDHAVDDDAVSCWSVHRVLWDEGGV